MSLPEISAALAIARVTVYPQSALVERRGRLELPSGRSRLSLAGLPGELTADSVRVRVEPGEGLVIQDVSAGEKYLELAEDREQTKLKARYDELLADQKKIRARLANSLSELGLFLDRGIIAERFETEKYLSVNVASWKEFFGFLRERLAENRALYRENLFALLEAEKKLAAAQANLSRLPGERRTEHEVAVMVEAPRAAAYALAVSYLQERVFWYPVYALAGEPGQPRLTVSLSAVVGQATGEDWRDVELELSTAVPRFSCSIPELRSRRLREDDSKLEVMRAAPAPAMDKVSDEVEVEEEPRSEMLKEMSMDRKERSRGAKKKAARQVMSPPASKSMASAVLGRVQSFGSDSAPKPQLAAGAPPAESADGEEHIGGLLREIVYRFEAELAGDAGGGRSDRYADVLFRVAGDESAGLPPAPESGEASLPDWMSGRVSPLESLGGYDYRFPVAGRRDIASSPVGQKVSVARKELPAALVYVAVPAEREAVYLKALISNDGEYPLPAGPAQVYAGDNLIGSLPFATLGLGEKGELSLGVDKDIKVLRRENTKRRRKGVIGRDKITDVEVEIELISFKDESIDIEIYDRLPLSRQPKDITVVDFQSRPVAKVTERKILIWKMSLAPRTKTVIAFQYSIRHPENFRAVLEEDPVPFQSGKEV
jgi:hypothetical protein